MTERTARALAALLSAIVLLPVPPYTSGQSLPTFPPPTAQGAGTVTAPGVGYVPPPDPPAPGTASPAPIPSDETDRAYWELFDRDKQVTLNGKVTKVNWTHPNVYIFIRASGIEWAVEANYSQFLQSSVKPPVQTNQTISVSGYLAKENPTPKWPVKSSPSVASYQRAKHLIRAAEITTEYGQKLRMGRPQSEEEEKAELSK